MAERFYLTINLKVSFPIELKNNQLGWISDERQEFFVEFTVKRNKNRYCSAITKQKIKSNL